MTNLARSALHKYQSAENSSIAYADPHQLISRLMMGAIERIAQAKGAIQQQNNLMKGEAISKAISIIGGLSACLDHNQEGDLSKNLEYLYEHMSVSLVEANVDNDTEKLDHVSKLMREISSAWMEIPLHMRK